MGGIYTVLSILLSYPKTTSKNNVSLNGVSSRRLNILTSRIKFSSTETIELRVKFYFVNNIN